MMRNFTIVLMLLITAAVTGYSETLNLTADAAVALALENNLSLQSEAINLKIKERGKDTAWNSFVPSVSASAGLSNSGTLFSDPAPVPPLYQDPTQRNWGVTGGLSASLPINAALGTGIRQLRIDYEAGLLSYDDARKKMDRDVRKSYYLLVATAADLELKKQNIEIAEKRYEQARENYNNGLISELEMLQAQVTAENSKPNYFNQVTEYQNSLMNFKLLLGVPSTTSLQLDEGMENMIFYSFDAMTLFEAYSANRLDVLQINKTIESLRNTRKLQSEYNRTPTLSLSADWGTQVNDPFKGDSWKKDYWYDNASVGLYLTLPLDGYIPNSSTDVSLKDLDDQITQLELQRQLVFDAAEIEITNLVMTLENSIDTIETYSLNVDLAEKSFQLTTEAYNLGTRELLDVETAQTELLSAQQNVLYQKINYINRLLDLQYALNAEDIAEILEER
ncbi:MAG: TolC family protein [Spirochaetales bacterium]|nr:TolC family protein [Spirochaetales bacterium]